MQPGWAAVGTGLHSGRYATATTAPNQTQIQQSKWAPTHWSTRRWGLQCGGHGSGCMAGGRRQRAACLTSELHW